MLDRCGRQRSHRGQSCCYYHEAVQSLTQVGRLDQHLPVSSSQACCGQQACCKQQQHNTRAWRHLFGGGRAGDCDALGTCRHQELLSVSHIFNKSQTDTLVPCNFRIHGVTSSTEVTSDAFKHCVKSNPVTAHTSFGTRMLQLKVLPCMVPREPNLSTTTGP